MSRVKALWAMATLIGVMVLGPLSLSAENSWEAYDDPNTPEDEAKAKQDGVKAVIDAWKAASQAAAEAPSATPDDTFNHEIACMALDAWNKPGGEHIQPRCSGRSHSQGDKIFLTTERLCGPAGDLCSTMVHEMYHVIRNELSSKICKKYNEKENRNPPAGESERYKKERNLMFAMYYAVRHSEEAAADAFQLYRYPPRDPSTPAPTPGYKQGRITAMCQALQRAERARDNVCSLLDSLDNERDGNGDYPSDSAPGFDIDEAIKEKQLVVDWIKITKYNKTTYIAQQGED